MTIIKRADLGRPLTWDELDDNFQQVDNLTAAASAAVSSASASATAAASSAASSATSATDAANSAANAAAAIVSAVKSTITFTTGGTLNSNLDRISDGTYLYYWTGAYPVTVPAASTVAGTGGIAAGFWAPDNSQAALSILGITSGATLNQGGTVQQSILYVTPEQHGATGDAVTDDTAAVQAALDLAATRSITANGIYIPQYVLLSRVYRITSRLDLNGAKVRLIGQSGGGLYFDPAGTFTGNQCIKVSGESNNAAYVGQSGPIFSNISFISSGKTLDLLYVVRTSSVSGDNGACLHNVSNISARGFNYIFTHGSGGWGWTWVGCQFSGNTSLMNIVTASDTYERHSFFGCTWQNGGYAFIMNNPDGRIYWHAGSIDYSDGLASITQGYLEANGHNEWTARSLPLVTILGSSAYVKMSGTLFIRNNTTTQYYIFNQYQSRQVYLDDVTFITDGVNVSYGLISNLEVVKGYIMAPNDAAKSILYNSADESIISGSTVYADYALTSTTNHSVSVSSGVITVTASAGGTTSFLNIDIPVTGKRKVAFKLIASNTSSSGAIFLNKYLRTLGGVQIQDLSSSGTASWAASSSNVAGGSITVFDIPKSAGYLRLNFNVANLTTGTSFSISSLKLFVY